MNPIFVIEFGIALCMIVFGINQLMHPQGWLGYIPEGMKRFLLGSPESTMRTHAVLNILFGLFLIFSFGHPYVAVWIAFVWWLTILPFAFRYNWAIGMRDLVVTLTLLGLILIL